ncbi:MAG: hypothetical protein ACFE0K_05480 [Alcanivorax sp.]|uniref:hypothetical protein n=1 Tax=Alcanivorax sp. TaxID=1872427 RepID=UPI003DA6E9BE
MNTASRTGIAALLALSASAGMASNTISFQGAVVYASCQPGAQSQAGYTDVIVESCGNQALSAGQHIARTYLEPVAGASDAQSVIVKTRSGHLHERIASSGAKPTSMRYVIEYH